MHRLAWIYVAGGAREQATCMGSFQSSKFHMNTVRFHESAGAHESRPTNMYHINYDIHLFEHRVAVQDCDGGLQICEPWNTATR